MCVTFMQKLPNCSANAISTMHPSDEMLMARHHVFSVYHKNGMDNANKKLLERRNDERITVEQCIGIDTELRFYDNFRNKFRLVPVLDCGDHVDFVGEWASNQIRIDVTTNIKKKKVADFADDANHLVVVWNIQEQRWESFSVKANEFVVHPLFAKG